MAENPYAPPQAHLQEPGLHADSRGPAYFPVSNTKLILMTLATFGMYQYFWFFCNWKYHQRRTGENVSPFWRTFFIVLFCYPLFKRMRDDEPDSEMSSLPMGWLAAAWIVPNLLWRLPDPYWLVLFLAPFALIPIQNAVNRINARVAPEHDPNTRFSGWNWAALLTGLPMFALAVFGLFFMPQQ